MTELEQIYVGIYEKYAQHEDIDLSRVITRKMIQDGESSISNYLELKEAIEDIAREWYRVDKQALRYSGISHFPEFEEVEKDKLENFIVYKYLRDVEKYQSPLILKVKQAEYEDYTEMMFYDILRLRKENKILIEYTPLNDDTYLVAYNYNGYAKYLEDKIEKEDN